MAFELVLMGVWELARLRDEGMAIADREKAVSQQIMHRILSLMASQPTENEIQTPRHGPPDLDPS